MPNLEEDALSSSVARRSRRRHNKKTATTRRAANNEKENAPRTTKEESKSRINSTVRRTTESKATVTISTTKKANNKRTETLKQTGSRKVTFSTSNDQQSSSCSWKYSSYEEEHETLHRFRLALEKISTPDIDEWKTDETLTESLVAASVCLGDESSNQDRSFYQDERTSRKLLSTCRKLVKTAVGNKETDNESSLHGLYVALHGIRAMSMLPVEVERSEAILRLLYHVITTVAYIIPTLQAQQGQATTKKNRAKMENYLDLGETTCLAGYQALSYILVQYSVPLGDRFLSFGFTDLEDDSSSKQPWRAFFPVPRVEKKQRKIKDTPSMTSSQIYTICMQSTLAMARMMGTSTVTKTGPFSKFLVDSDHSDTGLTSSQSATVHLLSSAGLSWARFLSINVPDEDGAIVKETVSYCQQAHRILWELSSCLSQHATPSGYCLQLRNYSLLILLAQSPDDSSISLDLKSSAGTFLCKKHFENICTMACKTSTYYLQNQQHFSLHDFHANLGSVLDFVGKRLPGESYPYAEYCAYRALHVGSGLEQMADTSADNLSKASTAALAIFSVSLQLRDYFQQQCLDSHTGSNEMSNCLTAAFTGKVRTIIQAFRSIFFYDSESHSAEVILRCCKILTLAPLHTTVFKLSSLPVELLAERIDLEKMRIAAEIMSTCVGPLAYLLITMRGCFDSKKETYIWDFVVESHARAAVVWDTLHSIGSACDDTNDDQRMCDKAIRELMEIFSRNDECVAAPSSLIEKAAKIFSSMGKRRATRDEKESALFPLLHSLSLFQQLANEPSRDISEFNISARISLIAGIFQSIKKNDAASLATILAILSDSPSGFDDESDMSLSILHYIGSKTNGFVDTGQRAELLGYNRHKASIRRLAKNLLEQTEQSTEEGNDQISKRLTTTCAVSILVSAVEDKTTGYKGAGNLASLCQAHFDKKFKLAYALRALQTDSNGDGDKRKIWLILSIMEDAGKMIQLSSALPTVKGLAAYDTMTSLLLELIASLPLTKTAIAALTATSLIAASSCLLADSSIFNSVSLGTPAPKRCEGDNRSALIIPFALRFAEQAYQVVCRDKFDQVPLLSALRTTILMYHHNLSKIVNSSTHSACNDVTTVIDDNSFGVFSSKKTGLEAARSCVSYTLSRLRDRLAFQGDELLASRVAILIGRTLGTGDVIHRQWSDSRTINLMLASGLLEVAQQSKTAASEFKHPLDDSEALSCWYLVTSTEQLVSCLRLQLLTSASAVVDHCTVRKLLQERLSKVEVKQLYSKDVIETATLSWIQSSILLALSEVDESGGYLQHALSRMHDSYQACNSVTALVDVLKSAACGGSSDSISRLILPTIVIGSYERRIDCLNRTASLYAKLGDHRRCGAYALAALKSCGDSEILASLKPKTKLSDLLSLFRENTADSLREESCRRRFIWFKAIATRNDLVAETFFDVARKRKPLLFNRQNEAIGVLSRSVKLASVYDFSIVENYSLVSNLLESETVGQLYNHASELYDSMMSEQWYRQLSTTLLNVAPSLSSDRLLTPVFFEVKLAEIRKLLSESVSIGSNTKEIISEQCLAITKASFAPNSCRAWASYYLGLLELQTARQSGHLMKLWSGYSNMSENPRTKKRRSVANCIQSARNHLFNALVLLGPATELLTRDVLRSLALATGPDKDQVVSAMSACMLLHTSIGSTPRQELCRLFKLNDSSNCALSAMDVGFSQMNKREDQIGQLLSSLGDVVLPSWRFVAGAFCPSGELLLTSLQLDEKESKLRSHTTCIFPMEVPTNQNIFDDQLYSDVVKPLDALIQKSQQQLRGIHTSSGAKLKFNDTSTKRGWWNEREEVDRGLQDLLSVVERNYLDAPAVRESVFGYADSPFMDDSNDSLSIDGSECLLRGADLTAKFDAVCLTPRKPSRGRASRSDNSCKQRNTKSRSNSSSSDSSSEFPDCRRHARRSSLPLRPDVQEHTFLILDENLHRFPMEGLPSFLNRSVSRLPSLSFVLAHFLSAFRSKEVAMIDPSRCSYILDPEANLGATQERLLPFINDITEKRSWDWRGVVGETPSSSFIEESLQQEDGLLLYFGHGGGQNFYSRSQVEALMESREDNDTDTIGVKDYGCRSSVVLMGCSSGKLESINRKDSESLSSQPLFYEPEGIALSYMLAGAPCVVANLWDVTDHDIDRYCLDLLKRILESPRGKRISMAQAVAEARAACKMPYIVGCAPVCYGLPVFIVEEYSRAKQKRKAKR